MEKTSYRRYQLLFTWFVVPLLSKGCAIELKRQKEGNLILETSVGSVYDQKTQRQPVLLVLLCCTIQGLRRT